MKYFTIIRKLTNDMVDYTFGTKHIGFLCDKDASIYPLDLEFSLLETDKYYKPMDANCIPLRNYVSVGKQYNPTRIAAYGLANYNRWATTGDVIAKYRFFLVAEWFLENSRARYEYYFDWNELKSPWISCMAQGEAASVLVRAYRLTSKEKFLRQARLALEPFLQPIEAGGVQSYIDKKWVFLEEYPTQTPTQVLNGFMYALTGLIEYCELKPDDEVMVCLCKTLKETLLENIDQWGSGNWSFYHIPKSNEGINFCTPKYHNLHISQLTYLSNKLGSDKLHTVAKRWQHGSDSIIIRLKALVGKVIYRIRNRSQI